MDYRILAVKPPFISYFKYTELAGGPKLLIDWWMTENGIESIKKRNAYRERMGMPAISYPKYRFLYIEIGVGKWVHNFQIRLFRIKTS